jgi:hypothetical protein
MKKIFFLAWSIGLSISLSAQSEQNNVDLQDPTAPKVAYPRHNVDTPHFQSAPAEGRSDGPSSSMYCASMVGSRIAVIYKGKTIIDNRTFLNGTVIFKDGTVVLSTGERKRLKDGECLDGNGVTIQ